MLLRMVDSAYPPTTAECEELDNNFVNAVAGYIGGRAANRWPLEAWKLCAGFGFQLLPIWVGPQQGEGHAAGAEEGNRCLEAMQWLEFSGVVCLDVEADAPVSITWLDGFVDALSEGDCGVIVYCTSEAAAEYVVRGDIVGYWIANWRADVSSQDLVPDCIAWQYRGGTRWDYSVLSDSVPLATLNPR